MKASNSAWVCILGHIFQKQAAKSFLGTVLAENRMDQGPQMIFSDACGREGSLACCMQEGKDVASLPHH